MRQVNFREITAHKVNPANDKIDIHVTDAVGAGGANHRYECFLPDGRAYVIDFQNGPIAENGVNGLTQEVLLAIVADRLKSFQAGPFACDENAVALEHVNLAQGALHARTKTRVSRGVEGTNVV